MINQQPRLAKVAALERDAATRASRRAMKGADGFDFRLPDEAAFDIPKLR